MFRSYLRLQNTNWYFYKFTTSPLTFYSYWKNYYNGIKMLWKLFSSWIISIFLLIIIFYYLLYIKTIIFNKVLFNWFLIIMFIYWFISGFVYFIKKYQFSKFTSVVQRFWKRSYILFWMIEGGVFLVFFFLTLNASEEPIYMYDQLRIYKTHLFSWRWFLIKLVPSLCLILLGYFLKNTLKWSLFNKQTNLLLIITLIFVFILWLEFYQFFHLINFYSGLTWVFEYDGASWILETEQRRTRISNNYVVICLLAKFWHLIFIFIFWIFFILRINEIERIRYFLLSANLQNFLIMYLLVWLYMYPWLKFLGRSIMDIPYYWFLLNSRKLGIRIFFNDIKLYYYAINLNYIFNSFLKLNIFYNELFYYCFESSSLFGFTQFKKHCLRDSVIYIFLN